MSGDVLSTQEVLTLFEAARWAPSTYNEQEWKFIYSVHGSDSWKKFFDLLVEANQVWCQKASMLCVITGRTHFSKNGKPNPVHLFDCGNAFENLALQGTSMGLVVHGMSGFDYEKAKTVLNIPDTHVVVAMFAVGRPGNPEELPEKLKEVECPSPRKPLEDIISEGKF